ncbi:efflux RND transporter periplasmic adaptor subunit [Shewanella surugensis]|uniref:Efflux RND transporter periplasmic adaptor subunit n=1 Tax=Shewanella surugensis TaxID=212020 RepID=A0ABT0LFV0_9GAMM|nr:efflux RND transporter periplasmic adaptor subunit [Shewanella surugensis]MCL1126573.1 efflux RND transporter periplasmic adaptor subunit [Shewanella surugensis]
MKLKSLTIGITLISAFSIVAIATYTQAKRNQYLQDNTLNTTRNLSPKTSPEIEVITVNQDDYQTQIIGYGEAKPQYSLRLTTEVSGQVDSLSPTFETGRYLKKGDKIATLNKLKYQQAAANAQVLVINAKIALLEEERKGVQARMEWTNSGMKGQPDSKLVLRGPQLIAAKAVLSHANSQLNKAQRNLTKTQITAPFNALIVSSDVQPGRYLQIGSKIGTLYSTDQLEISIPLSAQQWKTIGNMSQLEMDKKQITLTNTQNAQKWQGKIDRIEQHLDQDHKQRALIVTVDNPLNQKPILFPGTFLEVKIKGHRLHSIWKLPASCISQTGDIWYVDPNDQLTSFKGEKLFEKDDHVYITPINNMTTAHIVKRPLNSYFLGMHVNPRTSN